LEPYCKKRHGIPDVKGLKPVFNAEKTFSEFISEFLKENQMDTETIKTLQSQEENENSVNRKNAQ